MVHVRLTRKLANVINGIDLSSRRAGEGLDLPAQDARILILEGWAIAADKPRSPDVTRGKPQRSRNAKKS
jgi:hypothetical protein